MIHIVVGTGHLFRILGHMRVNDPKRYVELKELLQPITGKPIETVTNPNELAGITAYDVFAKFHAQASAELRKGPWGSEIGSPTLVIRHNEMMTLAYQVYNFLDFNAGIEEALNSLAIHKVFPHGTLKNGTLKVYLPDLAIGATCYGCFAASRGFIEAAVRELCSHFAPEEMPNANLIPGLRDALQPYMPDGLCTPEKQRQFVDKYWKEMVDGTVDGISESEFPRLECHLCDTLKVVYDRATKRRELNPMPSRSQFWNDSEDEYLVVDAFAHCFWGLRSLRGDHPEVPAIGNHRLLACAAIRQGIGKPTISALFPISLWETMKAPAVRHILLSAAEKAGADDCLPVYPNTPSREDMKNLCDDIDMHLETPDIAFRRHCFTLKKLGIAGAVENRLASSDNLDWYAAILECMSSLYDDDIEQSLHIQKVLDLYPLHKRVLGLLEYVIVPHLKKKASTGGASSLWAAAFNGPHRQCRAIMPNQADWWATLETLGNWLLIANGQSGGTNFLDLAQLLDAILLQIQATKEVDPLRMRLDSAVTPSEHGAQLNLLGDQKNDKAACMTFYLGKVALQLRNAIEHATDEVVSGGLRVNCPGIWQGKPGVSLDDLQKRARGESWRLAKQLSRLQKVPDAANALLLTPASLHRCLALISLVLHAAQSHLGL